MIVILNLIGSDLWGLSEKVFNITLRDYTGQTVAAMLGDFVPDLWSSKFSNLGCLFYTIHSAESGDPMYDYKVAANSNRSFKDLVDSVIKLNDDVDYFIDSIKHDVQEFRSTFTTIKSIYAFNNLVLDTNANCKIDNWTIDSAQQFNSITVFGQAEIVDDDLNTVSVTLKQTVDDVGSDDIRLEKLITDNTVNASNAAYLESKARYYLDLYNDVITEFDIEILDPTFLNKYSLGEIIKINSDNEFETFTELFKVQAIKTKLNSEGRTEQIIEVYQRKNIPISTTRIPKTARLPNGRAYDGFIEQANKNLKIDEVALGPFTGHGVRFTPTPKSTYEFGSNRE